MKSLSVSKTLFLALTSLVLVQLACGAGNAVAPAATLPAAATAPASDTQGAPAATSSGEHGTAAEAQAMLKLAVEHYQQVGRDRALADFNSQKPPFHDRDLYVVCMNSSHIETANGGFPQYVGSSADLVKDVNGNPLGKEIWDAASGQPQGSLPYQWINPVSGQMESKVLFFQKLDQDVCGVGVYGQ